MYSDPEGAVAVRFARAVIETRLGGRAERPGLPPAFDAESGAFVTLVTHPGRELRGCIGYIEAIKPLGRTIEDVAVSAALRDPRFPKVTLEEMDGIAVEVSLLTPLEPVPDSGEGLLGQVVVGRDGLVVERGPYRGVLLPQVPLEYGWDARTFLRHTCMKAGLPPDAWLDPATRFFRFSAEVFEEVEPRGKVRRKALGEE